VEKLKASENSIDPDGLGLIFEVVLLAHRCVRLSPAQPGWARPRRLVLRQLDPDLKFPQNIPKNY
jgi:hypothetical protein